MAEHRMDMDEPSQEIEPDKKDVEKTVEFYLEAFEMEIRGLLTESDVKKLILYYGKFDTDEKKRLSQYAEKETPLKIFDEIIKSIRTMKNEHLKYIALAQAFKKMDHEKVHLILTGKAVPTNDTHRQLIYHCGVDICQRMVVDQILPVLVMADVVCDEDRQAIQSKLDMKGNWQAAFQLLNCLSNKKVEWYPTFITILLEHQHQDLADLINRELKKMWDSGEDTTVSMSFSQQSGVASSSSSWDMHEEQSSVVEHVMTDHQDAEPMNDLDTPPPVPPRFDSFHKTENGTISKSVLVETNTDVTNMTNEEVIYSRQKDTSERVLKEYELELAENAVAGKNTVICAGTGTCKTWVALHVVKEHLTRASQGKRKVVFMARTSTLIKQQADRFKKYLPQFQTKLITGANEESSNIGSFLELYNILCFTPQVLLNYLDIGSVNILTELSLIILDECQHTQKDEPYYNVMRKYLFEKTNGKQDLPQVIGLTASIGVGKSHSDEDALDYMLHLFASLDVRDLSTVQRCTDAYEHEINHAAEELITMTIPTHDPCKDILLEAIKETEYKLKCIALLIPDMVEMMMLECPDDKQSQEFNKWTVEVEKMAIQTSEDDETVRNISTCATYLNVYNAALEANTLLRPFDVVMILAKKYKKESQRDNQEKLTNEEKKLLVNLQSVQMKVVQHGNTENQNIRTLCDILKKMMLTNIRDSRAMVFVKARATCVALAAFLKKDFKELGIDSHRLYGKESREGQDGMTESEQNETVEKFRTGFYKILVSTSVGIDVPDCNIVLNFLGNETTKIRMKGQSCKKEGHNVMMGNEQPVEHENKNVYKLAMMQRALKLFYKMDPKLIEKKITLYQQEMSFKVLSLEEALQKEPNTSVNVAVKVLEVGDFVTYTNKDNQERNYYSIVIADHSTFKEVRSYNINLMNELVQGSSVLLKGILRKTGEHSFWIVSSSTAIKWTTVEIPEALVLADTTNEAVTPLAQAVISPSTSKVVAKILQTSPLKYRKNGELPIKFIRLQDHEDGPRVKLALFGDHATQEYKEGDVVRVSDTYKWKQTQTLSTMISSKIEFLTLDLFNIPTDGVPVCEDSDFKEDSEPEQITVMSVAMAHMYKCCPNNECKNKRLEGDKCPACKSSCLTREKWYCYATVKVQRGDNQLHKHYKLFKDNLDKIFKLPNLKTSDSSSFKQSLSDQLPANGTAVFKNGSMTVLSAKRRLSE